MGKRTESLLFKFGVIFVIFIVVMLALSGLATYNSQMHSYKQERETSIQQIATYLETLVMQDGDDFLLYKNYMIAHYNDLCIPPVFRIGGDEFVVVLENHDYDHIGDLVAEFNRQLEALAAEEGLEQWERVSASVGYALFDAAIDAGVENVFRRADKAMYARKKEMKAVREN